MKDLRKIQEFFSKPVEDKIDTITMDVPLFLRTLEYAREDAKDDMDLHDVTEKAIKGTKQKGILSMVDYDDLTKQKIKEVIQQVISEEKTKRDRCLRIADRKFDKPSAYKSGAVVRCRKGKIWKNLKEEILSNLTTIEPYNDPDDEYSQDLDSYLKDDNIDWKKESYITLLNPNQIQPSEWNSLSDDPQNAKSIKYSKIDPSKFPPILALKTGPNSYEAIDGIHRVYAFRLNNHMIPAIVISPKLEQGLSTSDTQMVNFMFNKYEDNNIPTPTKINNLQEIGDSTSKTFPWKLTYKEGNINKPDGGYVRYEFKTDSGLEYVVIIQNINKFLDIDFVADGNYDEVNKGELFKVMATITNIIKNVISKSQDILGIRYNPKSKGLDFGIQRDQLYRAYILKNIPGIKFINQGGTVFGIFPKNINEDESLHKWFKRQGPSGKEGGWVDCNTCRTTDGKTKCKACGRKKGEKRSKYPSCRPTPAKCKDKGKGKTWGKTK